MEQEVNFIVWHYDNQQLAEANEQIGLLLASEILENSNLRAERDHWRAAADRCTCTEGELRRVRAAWEKDRNDNAKLRELCAEIWSAWQHSEFSMMPKLLDRMRELGVEVGG